MMKLDANESPLNLPPTVAEAVGAALADVAFNRYPTDAQSGELRALIAEACNLAADNVWLGNGSSEVIEKLCLGHRRVAFPTPSFSMYPVYAQAAHAEAVAVPLDGRYDLDVERYVAAVNESRADLAIVCNPNNPTGNLLAPAQIEFIARSLHEGCLLLVDEAYIEFSGQASSTALLAQHPRMAVARTFSKAFGLASIRLGYLLADPDIIADTARRYMPYHTNVLALAVGRAAFAHRDEFAPRIAATIAERDRVFSALATLPPLTVYPSAANFLLLALGEAAALDAHLRRHGIAVRAFNGNARLRNALRLSLGTAAENNAALAAITDFTEELA